MQYSLGRCFKLKKTDPDNYTDEWMSVKLVNFNIVLSNNSYMNVTKLSVSQYRNVWKNEIYLKNKNILYLHKLK